jgi:hypothetical protein
MVVGGRLQQSLCKDSSLAVRKSAMACGPCIGQDGLVLIVLALRRRCLHVG